MKKMKKSTRTAFLTYLSVILVFAVMYALDSAGMLSRSLSGQLVPICCYMSMAVSLNPVSYTHLDVYKRQGRAGPGQGPAHPPAAGDRGRQLEGIREALGPLCPE